MMSEIIIHPLSTIEHMKQVEELQKVIWSGSDIDVVPSHLTLTIAHNGGLVIGAFEGEKVIGYVFGFLGTDSRSPQRVAMARLKHCSHQLGVHPDYQNRGIGYQLKLAQREAVLEQGIRLITWTFDPLLSQNAHLNLRRLGVVCNQYLREVYGLMRDGLNVGLPSDRFMVDWWITSSRVISHVEETRRPLDLANFLNAGAQILNPATYESDEMLYPREDWEVPQSNFVLVEIPSNYLLMKAKDIEVAYAWRIHSRAIFEQLFATGYLVTDFIHLKEEHVPRSYYVLSFGEEMMG